MENVFFAGDWPAGRAGDWPAGQKWRFAAATGKGPGKGRGRGRHRYGEDRLYGIPPFGGPGMGFGPPRGRGRSRRRRGDVRMAILMLLAEEPRNGYQLMQTIEERSDGDWRPSPGSVYPVLSQLEDEGLIRATERDGAKLFELTDAGREYVESAETQTPPWESPEAEDDHPFRQLKHLIPELARASAHVLQSGDEAQVAQAIDTLKEARRKLYRILAEDEEA
jgi:DNA-binding PadR family transcriptional regulator